RRGGGMPDESLNKTDAAPLMDPRALPPDVWFDQQWATTLLARALKRDEEECEQNGKKLEFEALSPWLTGDSEYGDQAALAESLGVPANTLKSLVSRLRKRFRSAVKNEVARTLDGTGRVDSEMNALFTALGSD
ncbi:MAG: sigma-70 family RNA polymerase sigma factor, partial [Verrucomicrobiota bacterium]